MYGSSNWYKQRDNLRYMYSRDFDIRVFDLSTRQFTQDNFTLTDNGWQREPCVAGDDNYLYYLSSGVANGPWKDVHFLSFGDIDAVWQRGPDMISRRGEFACAVSPNNRVYAIGGITADSDTGTPTDTIEYISTIDFESNSWILLSDTLSEPTYFFMQSLMILIFLLLEEDRPRSPLMQRSTLSTL